jgi:hydroxyacylglutathione hydrolase
MPVIATPVGNRYDHVSYLVSCPATGEATAIDPFHLDLVLDTARANGLAITQIVNTHEHWDHAGRNDRLRAETGARVLAPKAAAGVIEHVDAMLVEGSEIAVGERHRLRVLETPGHTMTHVSLLGEDEGVPFLLCGDTLFGAGVGNCGYGGHVGTLFATVERLAAQLAPETLLYPGHDYLARNLEFTLSVEPGNARAQALLEPARARTLFTTIADEREISLFFRLDAETVRRGLHESAGLEPGASREEVFAALRAMRDRW